MARIYRFARLILSVDAKYPVDWTLLARPQGYGDQAIFSKGSCPSPAVRSPPMNDRSTIDRVLAANLYLVLGTADEQGQPWDRFEFGGGCEQRTPVFWGLQGGAMGIASVHGGRGTRLRR